MIAGSSPPLTRITQLLYGFGSVAFGIKDTGFSYFLLFFYTQLMGVSPELVGLALFVAFLIDALSDPLVGCVSDRWRSGWGRRHTRSCTSRPSPSRWVLFSLEPGRRAERPELVPLPR